MNSIYQVPTQINALKLKIDFFSKKKKKKISMPGFSLSLEFFSLLLNKI